ncbi:hypothetical protein H8S37_04040 [Mediterraneibacter sp. NSJ-55]|uniref:Uncharacterized protein n=1 Tax=Mediterraneibacter hominis TaxID=2763054 RepID=A0A923LHH2_9FIRM|nr:hypothetical protein [Mediterraneibacter hominis]MBC5688104.1 hypothetical protein [Mediterraneibacter hominis]
MVNNDFLNDMFKAYDSSYRAKDQRKMDIAIRKKEFENTLDKMWKIYVVNPNQIIEYNKQVVSIKECGCKIYRNSDGKHKIVIG